ncbi:hypothetical protein ACFWCB_25960, partial [Streptomyces sp. NPDC060048]
MNTATRTDQARTEQARTGQAQTDQTPRAGQDRPEEALGDWEELVGAALLGTDRRQGSPEALLGAAAVQTVRRRAGLRPAEAGPRPE